MSIVVVGSVAFDSLKTPYGVREKVLGGAATYFSLSASHFTDVRVVAVVGDDSKVQIRQVRTGEKVGALWVVEDGLKAGDKIVAEGTQKVREGMQVAPKPYQAEAKKASI